MRAEQSREATMEESIERLESLIPTAGPEIAPIITQIVEGMKSRHS
jgi:hypothetical protein